MPNNLEGARSKDSLRQDLPKVISQGLRTPFFQRNINGRPIADTLLEISAPIADEITEIETLLQKRQIKRIEYADYVNTSPYFEQSLIDTMALVSSTAKVHAIPPDISQLTKEVMPFISSLTTMRQGRLAADSKPRTRAVTISTFSTILSFISSYIEMRYLQTTIAQIQKTQASEGIPSRLRQTESYLRNAYSKMDKGRGDLKFLTPSIHSIAQFVERAGGELPQTLDLCSRAGDQVSATPENTVAALLRDVQDAAVLDFAPLPLYAQIQTSTGVLQCEIVPLTKDLKIEAGMFGSVPGSVCSVRYNIVPPGHRGYYLPPPIKESGAERTGVYFSLSGISDTLIIPGTLAQLPLSAIVDEQSAKKLSDHALTLAREAFTHSYQIGTPVPEQLEAQIAEPEHEVEEESTEAVHRLPRDITGDRFVQAIRKMNRTFLKERGVQGEELELQSDPRLRQKGSHATIYCAETGKIASVPLHANALPPGTLHNVIKMLGLDHARFIQAIE